MFTNRIHVAAKCGLRKIGSFKGKEFRNKLERSNFDRFRLQILVAQRTQSRQHMSLWCHNALNFENCLNCVVQLLCRRSF